MESPDREAERRLGVAVAGGDPEAARRLVESYLPAVYGYVFGRTGLGAEVAAELAQETLVAALGAVPRFRGESTLLTWLCAIARRKVADHYRRESRRPLSLDEPASGSLALMDRRPLPDEVAESDELAAAVHRAVWTLPGDQREAVLLKYIEGEPVAAIAARLGRSEKAAESLLSRGRATLRERLAAWGRPAQEDSDGRAGR